MQIKFPMFHDRKFMIGAETRESRTMASKEELISHLVKEFKATRYDNGGFNISFPAFLNQPVFVMGVAFEDKCILLCPFATESEISPEELFKLETEIDFGFQKVNEAFALTNLLWLENVDASEVRDTVNHMHQKVREIKQELFGV
jgi:hypothetical protein